MSEDLNKRCCTFFVSFFFINIPSSAVAQTTIIKCIPDVRPPSPKFHGGQKVQHLASFSTTLDFEPPRLKMQQDYLNSGTNLSSNDDRPMSAPSLVKFGQRTPREHMKNATPLNWTAEVCYIANNSAADYSISL